MLKIEVSGRSFDYGLTVSTSVMECHESMQTKQEAIDTVHNLLRVCERLTGDIGIEGLSSAISLAEELVYSHSS